MCAHRGRHGCAGAGGHLDLQDPRTVPEVDVAVLLRVRLRRQRARRIFNIYHRVRHELTKNAVRENERHICLPSLSVHHRRCCRKKSMRVYAALCVAHLRGRQVPSPGGAQTLRAKLQASQNLDQTEDKKKHTHTPSLPRSSG